MTAPAPHPDDRLERLQSQSRLTGIDFVHIHDDQTTLDVYFVVSPSSLAPQFQVQPDEVRIESPDAAAELRRIPVTSLQSTTRLGREVLRLQVGTPGDFVTYRLSIDTRDPLGRPRVDPLFNDVPFSFKAGCPSALDCAPEPVPCPDETRIDVPIDYRARDFWSFRRALLDLARVRYPEWNAHLAGPDGSGADRVADVGIMLTEALSALGDEAAYYQDRVARELYLETASQRRSVRRHVHLVDYAMHEGIGPSTWIDVEVDPNSAPPSVDLAAGTLLLAVAEGRLEAADPDAGPEEIPFEIGRGLIDVIAGASYRCESRWNALTPHLWDGRRPCLAPGTTEVAVRGHDAANLPLTDTPGLDEADRPAGRWVLLESRPDDPALPMRAWPVRVIERRADLDPLATPQQPGGVPVTWLRWEAEQAIPFEVDVRSLRVRANLVPATAGRTIDWNVLVADGLVAEAPDGAIGPVRFAVSPDADQKGEPRAVERLGPDGTTTYLFTLPGSDARRLVWRPQSQRLSDIGRPADPRHAHPEVALIELDDLGLPRPWRWRRSLVGTRASGPSDEHFTLDNSTFAPLVHYRRGGERFAHVDYRDGEGVTIRFGDGEFGAQPHEGSRFEVRYRLGATRRANVPAGAIQRFAAGAPAGVVSIRNPLPIADGIEPESIDQVRRLAPQAFRHETYRAVRPEDYAEAAQRLPWVQRAGARLRWTGSWLSLVATADPRDENELRPARRRELEQHLDRFRQAGRDVRVGNPSYVDVDLDVLVCVEPTAFPGDVVENVLVALVGSAEGTTRAGFFDPDAFSFGAELLRSAFEAAIQRVPGVRAVVSTRIRRRHHFDWREFSELEFAVAPHEILRVANDPTHPERGTVRVRTEGGA